MGVSYMSVAGYGLRVNLTDVEVFQKPELQNLREYIWSNTSDHAQTYFENDITNMFSEDYFDVDSISDSFSALRFIWCGNPYTERRHDDESWFAFAQSTYVSTDDTYGWFDLSKRNSINEEEHKQLQLLAPLSREETPEPRWYMFGSVG